MFLKIWNEFCIFIAGNTQLGRRLEVAAYIYDSENSKTDIQLDFKGKGFII